MEEANAFFKVIDRYGPTMAFFAACFLFAWKIAPRIVDAWVRKIEAETEAIRQTGEAVRTTIPTVLGEIKTAHVQGFEGVKTALVATEGRIVASINGAVGADTDRRIEAKLHEIAQDVRRTDPDIVPGVPPTVRGKLPSRHDR